MSFGQLFKLQVAIAAMLTNRAIPARISIRAAAVISVALLIGCQTLQVGDNGFRKNEKTSVAYAISAKQWLLKSLMPKVSDKILTAHEAAYFLRKVGFDPSPDEVSPWLGKTRYKLIDAILSGLSTTPVVPVPEWTRKRVRYWGHRHWPKTRRSSFRATRRQEVGAQRQWWIKQMLATPSPMGERLVLFWENTFVAGFSGLDKKSHAQWIHHQTIREHALGNYKDLVRAMLRDPAVLIYLDNNRNRKDSPNENLARELFELYTLGEGNYTEKDIKEAARTLAGWHVSEFGELSFVEKPWARDYGEKKIFGRYGRFDGDDLVDLIFEQDASREHVVRRLWSEFVSAEPAPDGAVAFWSEAFQTTGYELSQLLEVILYSEYFWDPRYRGTSSKSPVEFVIGSLRYAQTDRIPVPVIDGVLGTLGQTLFDPPDVSGWGYGEYWLDPSFLIERERFQEMLVQIVTTTPMTANAQKSIKNSPKKLKLKLAGEAYKGPPMYRVTMNFDGGIWQSDLFEVETARDTERLGRYKDESEWVWSVAEIEVPEHVTNVTQIGVSFPIDAAGNGGDRNLFVGGIEWDNVPAPPSMAKQIPGCRKNKQGAKRHPGRLYCRGTLTFDWKIVRASQEAFVHIDQQEGLENPLKTKELVLLWLKPPSKGGRQSVNLMFDGLEFGGRTWDYFGFSFAIDQHNRFNYLLSIKENRCNPACFKQWPSEAWKDKAERRHVSVYLNNHEHWADEQYNGLGKEDKDLVKALFSVLPQVADLVKQTEAHQEPGSKKIWIKRMAQFIDMADTSRWRLERQPKLVETDKAPSALIKESMMGMMSMSASGGGYTLATAPRLTRDHWHMALEGQLTLAAEPLEAWGLSVNEGVRLFDLTDVIVSPYMNLK